VPTRGRLAGFDAKRVGEKRGNGTQMIAYDLPQAAADPRAQRARLVPQYISKPVTALTQHVREQPLDVAPIIVEPLKQQLHIHGKLLVMIRGRQSLTGSAIVELVRSLGNHQTTHRPSRSQ